MMLWPRSLTVPRAPDFIIGEPDAPYLLRWYVIPRNKWFNIYLHRFVRSDDDRALHDHPWVNMSILLSGSYREHRLGKPARVVGWGSIVVRRPTFAHRVELIGGQPVWTLFLTGPKIREWGFHCPKGWRRWQDFVVVRDGGNGIGRGCED